MLVSTCTEFQNILAENAYTQGLAALKPLTDTDRSLSRELIMKTVKCYALTSVNILTFTYRVEKCIMDSRSCYKFVNNCELEICSTLILGQVLGKSMMGRYVPVHLLSDVHHEKYLNSIKSTVSLRQPIIHHAKAIDRLIMQHLSI